MSHLTGSDRITGAPRLTGLPRLREGDGDGGGGGGGDLGSTLARGAYPSLMASARSDTAVQLQWTSVDGATSYELQVDTDPAFPSPTTLNNGPARHYTHGGLSQGDVRYYRVRGVGSEAEAWSLTRRVVVEAPVYPADLRTYATAISLRKVRSAYAGDVLSLRRVSDNATLELPFRNHEIDLVALDDFAETSTVRVTALHDQIESGAYVPNGDFDEPIIAVNGHPLIDDRLGRPVIDMLGGTLEAGNRFQRETALSTPIDEAGSMVALCQELTLDERPTSEQGGWGKPASGIGDGVLGLKNGHWSSQGAGTAGSPEAKTYSNLCWVGARFGASQHGHWIGPTRFSAPQYSLSGTYDQPELLASAHYLFSEAIIAEDVPSGADYQDRLFELDDYWRAAPTQSQYQQRGKADCRYWWQGEIIEWLKAQARDDYVMYAVASVSGSDITIADADWTHLQSGDTIIVGTETFTLTAAPTLSGGDSVCTVTESTSGVEVGDEALFKPQFDGSYGSDQEIADKSARVNGADSLDPKLAGRADPAWYVADTGEPDYEVAWGQWAFVDEANPDTNYGTTAQLQIKNNQTNRKVGLVEINLDALTQVPSLAVFNWWVGGLGSEDGGEPVIGVTLYEDVSWDASTVTWNTFPSALDLSDDYDAVEAISPGTDVNAFNTWRLVDEIRQAYRNGASTVTLMVYQVNDQDGSWQPTERTVFINTENAINPPENTLYQSRGYEATDALRVPDSYDGIYNYGGGRKVGFWSELDLPYNGGQGNPYKGETAAKRRGLMVDLLQANELHRFGNFYAWTRYPGGLISSLAETLQYGPTVLTGRTREAAKAALRHLAEPARTDSYTAGDNSNLDVKAVQGYMISYAQTRAVDRQMRGKLLEAAKSVLFADRSGDPTVNESPVWHQEGNIYENGAPEGSYLNRSTAHLARGRAFVAGLPEWAFVDTMLTRIVRFWEYQFGEAPDGTRLDCSGYSSRTRDALLGGQWEEAAKQALPFLVDEARYFARDLTDGTPRFGDAATEAAEVESTIDGLSAYTTQHEVPPIVTGQSTWQEAPGYAPPPDDWFATIRSWYDNDEPFTYPHFSGPSTEGPIVEARPASAGQQDWLGVLEDPTDGFGYLVDARRNSGGNGGWGGLHMIWQDNYGAIVSTRKPFGEGRDQLMNGVHGLDTDGSEYAFWAAWEQNYDANLVDVDASQGTARHVVEYKSPNTDPTSDGALFECVRRYTRLSESEGDAQTGVQVEVLVNYIPPTGEPDDQVDLLAETIPLVVHQGFELRYWDGSAWVQAGVDEVNTAKEWRVTQDFGSGPVYTWIRFENAQPCQLRPEQTIFGTTAHPFEVRLVDAIGEGADLPSQSSVTWTSTRTDPGFQGTAISSLINQPAVDQPFPEGGLWVMATEQDIPTGRTLDQLWYRYSTDGGATWTTFASLDVGSASKASGFGDEAGGGLIQNNGDDTFEYVGQDRALPAGLTHLKVVTEAGDGDQREKQRPVSSATPRTQVSDSFEAPDGTRVDENYTLDVGGSPVGTQQGGPAIINNRCQLEPTVDPGGWGQQWWAPTGETSHLIEATLVDVGSGGLNGALKALSSDSYYFSMFGFARSGKLEIEAYNFSDIETAFTYDQSEYILKMQGLGPSDVAVLAIYAADGSGPLEMLYTFDAQHTREHVGVRVDGDGFKLDDFSASTFAP